MDFYKECLVEKVMTPKERIVKYMSWGAISFVLFALAVWGFVLFSPIGRVLFLIAVAVLVLDKAYLAIVPGIAIMLLVLSFMLIGNALRNAMDVRS